MSRRQEPVTKRTCPYDTRVELLFRSSFLGHLADCLAITEPLSCSIGQDADTFPKRGTVLRWSTDAMQSRCVGVDASVQSVNKVQISRLRLAIPVSFHGRARPVRANPATSAPSHNSEAWRNVAQTCLKLKEMGPSGSHINVISPILVVARGNQMV